MDAISSPSACPRCINADSRYRLIEKFIEDGANAFGIAVQRIMRGWRCICNDEDVRKVFHRKQFGEIKKIARAKLDIEKCARIILVYSLFERRIIVLTKSSQPDLAHERQIAGVMMPGTDEDREFIHHHALPQLRSLLAPAGILTPSEFNPLVEEEF